MRRLTPQTASTPATFASSAQDARQNGHFDLVLVESETHFHYDHHFAFAGDSYRYLGSESCLLKSPRLEPRKTKSPLVLDKDDDEFHLSWKRSAAKEYELLELYLEIIQPVYPVLDLTERYLAQEVPADLAPAEIFCLNMIYSIGCYILPNTGKKQSAEHVWNPSGRLSYHQANSIKYRALASDYYLRAMQHLEAATIEPNLATLRAILMLAIHSSFDPKSGNMGQQIALAARLIYDLESKGEIQEQRPGDNEMLWKIHMTIFTLENQVASTLDRPALFPEPVRNLARQNHPRLILFRFQNCALRKKSLPNTCALYSAFSIDSVRATMRRSSRSKNFCHAWMKRPSYSRLCASVYT